MSYMDASIVAVVFLPYLFYAQATRSLSCHSRNSGNNLILNSILVHSTVNHNVSRVGSTLYYNLFLELEIRILVADFFHSNIHNGNRLSPKWSWKRFCLLSTVPSLGDWASIVFVSNRSLIPTRRILSQFLSFELRRSVFLNYIKWADVLILRLWNSERAGRVPDRLKHLCRGT